MACRRRVVFSPDDGEENNKKEPVGKERDAERSQLYSKIKASHREAQRRLLLLYADADAVLDAAGFCFGLLDPVSNIIVNALSAPPAPDASPSDKKKKKKKKKKGTRRREAVKGSAEGLLAFMTCFFPYLRDWEAVRYLVAAGADLALAVRLVLRDRCRRLVDYTYCLGAGDSCFKMALKCAALAANHGHPDRLVATWSGLSTSSLRELRSEITSDDGARRLVTLARLRAKLSSMSPVAGSPSQRSCSWEELAADRGHDDEIEKDEELASTMSLRRALLDTIHGHYLRAMARLPAEYHMSMLHAGHCYGPLDPVSNIVLNTAASCGPTDKDDDTLSGKQRLLLRAGARSLYGLASFLATRYPGLGFHAALRCLLSAGGHLQEACKEADRQLAHPHGSNCNADLLQLQEAYAAAAIAAWHPQPDAQASRLASLSISLQAEAEPSSSSDIAALLSQLRLQDHEQQQQLMMISCQHLERLANSLLLPTDKDDIAPPPSGGIGSLASSSDCKMYAKVKAALSKYYYANGTGDPEEEVEIHAICGVNDRVLGPHILDKYDRRTGLPYTHHYYNTHVNFLAAHCRNNKQPMLFFAELSNDDDDDDMAAAACPVTPPGRQPLPRCLYCDYEGSRIVHPPGVHAFHGRGPDFYRMVCKQDLFDDDVDPQLQGRYYTNSTIIRRSDRIAEWIEDGRYYFDLVVDDWC